MTTIYIPMLGLIAKTFEKLFMFTRLVVDTEVFVMLEKGIWAR